MLKGTGELRVIATGVAVELNCSQKQGVFFCVWQRQCVGKAVLDTVGSHLEKS